MSQNENEFLQAVTLRICSSLEVKTALLRTFEYLTNFFPVAECFFQIIDCDLGAIRTLTYISIDQNTPPSASQLQSMPQELWDWSCKQQRPYLVHRGSKNAKVRSIAEIVGLGTNQDLVLPLEVDNKAIGWLVLRTQGQDSFHSRHFDLINAIRKPLAIAMSNALAHEAVVKYRDLLLDDNQFLAEELQNDFPKDIIGSQGGLLNIMELVRQVAPITNTILLLGETGVGKEVIANAIHYLSDRNKEPFVKVNCGAIPDSLLDSELFGHEKGAFTGALTRKRGRFERANHGTLFLDEVGELPSPAQVRLLRVLQNQEIERVGGTETTSIDVRIIAATHQDLKKMISEKRFRVDLWFRLNVFPILIPPLRDRIEDIPELTKYFINKKCKNMRIPIPPGLAPGALELLTSYSWPGNVRELENVVERELIIHRTGPLAFKELLLLENEDHTSESPHISPKQLRLDEVISSHIQEVLSITKGKVHGPGGAAEMLGLNESTLRAKMRKLSICFGRKTIEENIANKTYHS